jgi:hypothetical protein
MVVAEFLIDTVDVDVPGVPGFTASLSTTGDAPKVEAMLSWQSNVGVTEWWVFDATRTTTVLWASDPGLVMVAVEAVLQYLAGTGPRVFSWSPMVEWAVRSITRDTIVSKPVDDVELVARIGPGPWIVRQEAGT